MVGDLGDSEPIGQHPKCRPIETQRARSFQMIGNSFLSLPILGIP